MVSLAILSLLFCATAEYTMGVTDYNYDCETRTGNYEGDLLLNDRQVDTIRSGRNPVITEADKWINNLVPYVLASDYLTPNHSQNIKEAMAKIEEVSTVRFVPRHQQLDFLVISGEPSGCWATFGRNRGMNRLNLDPSECLTEGTILHELLHVLGFAHETNSLDRDYYVDISWDHVRPEHVEGLQKYQGVAVPDYGLPFDVDSIMNFGPTHFCKDGLSSITLKQKGQTLGQREKLSEKDIKKLNMLYPCGYC